MTSEQLRVLITIVVLQNLLLLLLLLLLLKATVDKIQYDLEIRERSPYLASIGLPWHNRNVPYSIVPYRIRQRVCDSDVVLGLCRRQQPLSAARCYAAAAAAEAVSPSI